MTSCNCIQVQEGVQVFFSLYLDVSHDFNVSFSIIWIPIFLVSTGVWVIRCTSCTKSSPWIAWRAVPFIVANNTNSGFGGNPLIIICIKPFLVTSRLQRGLRTKERLPVVTSQWSRVVLSVSNQRVKRFSLPFDDHEVELLVNFHTETDLGEGSVPVSCPSNPVFSPGKLYSS